MPHPRTRAQARGGGGGVWNAQRLAAVTTAEKNEAKTAALSSPRRCLVPSIYMRPRHVTTRHARYSPARRTRRRALCSSTTNQLNVQMVAPDCEACRGNTPLLMPFAVAGGDKIERGSCITQHARDMMTGAAEKYCHHIDGDLLPYFAALRTAAMAGGAPLIDRSRRQQK